VTRIGGIQGVITTEISLPPGFDIEEQPVEERIISIARIFQMMEFLHYESRQIAQQHKIGQIVLQERG
jgi:hypothetical protein